jgi:hypothetical protein
MTSGSSYLQAFRTTGGDPIDTGQYISYYYILTNDWKVVSKTTSITPIELIFKGNLLTSDTSAPYALSETVGDIFIRSVITSNSLTTTDLETVNNTLTGITNELIIIDSGLTTINNNIDTVNDNVILVNDNIDAHRAATEDKIKYILGMVQQNFRVKNQVYDANNLLTSSTIRLYNNATDAQNDASPMKEYAMTAAYDAEGRLINYLVKEI